MQVNLVIIAEIVTIIKFNSILAPDEVIQTKPYTLRFLWISNNDQGRDQPTPKDVSLEEYT